MKKKKTKHHIIPKSRIHEIKKNILSDNIIELTAHTHDALHRLFSNKTPKEQLKMRLRINQKVLNNNVKKQLRDIIHTPDKDFYY